MPAFHAKPCFVDRFRSMSRVGEIFTEVIGDLRVLSRNSLSLDFGDGVKLERFGRHEDYASVPAEHRHKLIPALDWVLDAIKRSGGGLLPVHGDLCEYVEYPDSLFGGLPAWIQASIDDMALITGAGLCDLQPQIRRLMEALQLAQEEAARVCGDKVRTADDGPELEAEGA